MQIIEAFTDGSACVAGPMKGRAGFGVYFPDFFGKPKAYSLGFEQGKTGEQEVCALLFAIRSISKKSNSSILLRIYSDSEYVVKTFTENRLEKWKKNDWKNTSGEVKNKELWMKIDEALLARSTLKLEMKHIKSHQVDREKDPEKKAKLLKDPHILGNLVVDELANYKRHKQRIPDISYLNLFK